MKNLFFLFVFAFSFIGFSQEKVKVRMKKSTVFVNKVKWASYEDAAGKRFISTLSGEEFVAIKELSYGTGRYFENTGREIMHHYCEVHFLKTDIAAFEVDANMWEALSLMYKRKVLVDDKFSLENAKEFKDRYQENVSEKVFLTK